MDGHLSHARPDEGNDGAAGLANSLALVVAPVEVLPHLLQVMLYNVFFATGKGSAFALTKSLQQPDTFEKGWSPNL